MDYSNMGSGHQWHNWDPKGRNPQRPTQRIASGKWLKVFHQLARISTVVPDSQGITLKILLHILCSLGAHGSYSNIEQCTRYDIIYQSQAVKVWIPSYFRRKTLLRTSHLIKICLDSVEILGNDFPVPILYYIGSSWIFIKECHK